MIRKSASAPGKLILSGEHSVVYGFPAIVGAVNLRLRIDQAGNIKSQIPIGSGMGSSAALSVAKSTLELGELNLEKINQLSYKKEKKFHGNPSGIDNTISTYGGLLWYKKEVDGSKIFRQIKLKVKIKNIFILNSGRPKETTRDMVDYVRNRYLNEKRDVGWIFNEMGIVTSGLHKFISGAGSNNFGSLINRNELLLERLGVVSESTIDIISKIKELGGYAKISGAGGRSGGSGIVLVYHDDPEKISFIGKKIGFKLTAVRLASVGVKLS